MTYDLQEARRLCERNARLVRELDLLAMNLTDVRARVNQFPGISDAFFAVVKALEEWPSWPGELERLEALAGEVRFALVSAGFSRGLEGVDCPCDPDAQAVT